MGFADICYQNTIPNFYNQSTGLFSLSDMQMFANTFVKHMYINPLQFSQTTCGQSCNGNAANISNDPAENSYFYLLLAKYDPDIYQIVSDVFCDRALYSNSVNPSFAFLAEQEHLFNPLAVNRSTPTDATWAGIAGGDFDGDGTQEFATVRNKDGAVEIYYLDATNHIQPRTNIINHTTPWSGVTAADLDATHAGDEIAAINTGDGNIYLYKQNGNSLVKFASVNTGITGTWTGISSGKLTGTNTNQIILSNSNGNVYLYQYNSNTQVLAPIIITNNYLNSNLAGITVGNFDLSHTGDEIGTINNSSNGNIEMTIYNFNNSTFSQLSIFNLAQGNYSDWNGITSGDFDGDGIDEIIAHRNYDGDFFIFKLDANAQVVNNYKEYFPVNQLNGIIGSVRFATDPSKDALISLRNYDGNMFVFNLAGLCPGLNLSNQNINDAYTIDNPYSNVNNNYNVDYHVHNTMTAGNNFSIAAPSIVTFTAGNEIILKDGFVANSGSDFHAYIDQGLSCNQQSFRHSNPNNSPNSNAAEQKPTTIIHNVGLTIFPNPNNGNFNYILNQAGEESEIYNAELIDLLGNCVFKNESAKLQNEISTENLAKGIYFLKVSAKDGRIWIERVIVN